MNRRRFLTAGAALVAAGCAPQIVGSSVSSLCQPTASGDASEIPAEFLAAYRQAATTHGLPWSLLAAIGYVETGHTADAVGPPLNGVGPVAAIVATPWGTRLHGDPQWERAVGPMQFLPGTFAGYRDRGVGMDPFDVDDAANVAAVYLKDNGAPGDVRGALLAYNRSQAYVDKVLEHAVRYDASGLGPEGGCQAAVPIDGVSGDPASILALADSGRIQLDERNRADVLNPALDRRVLALMAALAERHSYAVSVIKTGHYRCVGGGNVCEASRVSEHWNWRGLDVHTIDGQRVSNRNRTALDVVAWTHGLSGPLRPQEQGSPFGDFTATRGWFTDANHTGHLHFGYEAVTT